MEHKCIQCNKIYKDAKALKDHRYTERKAGRITGHEIKPGQSIATSSIAGSQFGTKDTKMKDVEFNVPDKIKTFNRILFNAQELGFQLQEQDEEKVQMIRSSFLKTTTKSDGPQ
jgi:hypothetical protein